MIPRPRPRPESALAASSPGRHGCGDRLSGGPACVTGRGTALQAAGTARRAPDLGPADFAAVSWHQLSFAGVAKLNRRPRLPRPDEDHAPASLPDPRWEQPELPAPGQSRLFHSRHWTAASVSNPALDHARAIASRLGEARGWNPRVQEETRRALAVMLASHVPGGKIPWSSLEPALRPRDLSVSRTAEILGLAGLLDDDRIRPMDTWTKSRLATLAPGIAACSTERPGPCLAAPVPPASTSAACTRSWNSGPGATITCARSPPATPPRRSPRCVGTSGAGPSPHCGP